MPQFQQSRSVSQQLVLEQKRTLRDYWGDLPQVVKCICFFTFFIGMSIATVAFIRFLMGCGCPAKFLEIGDECQCTGDLLSCRYNCPGDVEYCGQDPCGEDDDISVSSYAIVWIKV